MDEHLTRDLFRAIYKGWRDPGDLAAIAMAHLFEECSVCRKEFEAWRRELGEGVAAPESQDFDAVFDCVRASAAANDGDGTALEVQIGAERRRARSRADELLALAPDQRLEWIRIENKRISGVLLAEVLIEQCLQRTPGYPHEGKILAFLARLVLQHTPTSVLAVEYYALALAGLANAIRVIGDLPRADQILGDARYLLRAQGTGADRLVRARIDSLEASLRTGQDRPSQAIPLLLRALMVYEMEGPGAAADIAACLIKLCRAHDRLGAVGRALELADGLGEHAGCRSDPRLDLLGRRNRAAILIHAGRFEDAREALEEVRPFFDGLDDPLERLRFSWSDAKLLRSTGASEAAENLMISIRHGFGSYDLRYDEALAGVELAAWYSEEGRRDDALPLVEEALPVFEALELPAKITEARALWARLTASP